MPNVNCTGNGWNLWRPSCSLYCRATVENLEGAWNSKHLGLVKLGIWGQGFRGPKLFNWNNPLKNRVRSDRKNAWWARNVIRFFVRCLRATTNLLLHCVPFWMFSIISTLNLYGQRLLDKALSDRVYVCVCLKTALEFFVKKLGAARVGWPIK